MIILVKEQKDESQAELDEIREQKPEPKTASLQPVTNSKEKQESVDYEYVEEVGDGTRDCLQPETEPPPVITEQRASIPVSDPRSDAGRSTGQANDSRRALSLAVSEKAATEATDKTRSIESAATDGGSTKPPVSESAPTEKPTSNPSDASENRLSVANQPSPGDDVDLDKSEFKSTLELRDNSRELNGEGSKGNKTRTPDQMKSLPDIEELRVPSPEENFTSATDNRETSPDPTGEYRSVPDVSKPESQHNRPSISNGELSVHCE